MNWIGFCTPFSPYLGISCQVFKEPKSEFCGIAKKERGTR